MAGLAGGVAIASRRNGQKTLGATAKAIGKAGFKAGELAAEVRKVREEVAKR
jgi:hypothetical protein